MKLKCPKLLNLSISYNMLDLFIHSFISPRHLEYVSMDSMYEFVGFTDWESIRWLNLDSSQYGESPDRESYYSLSHLFGSVIGDFTLRIDIELFRILNFNSLELANRIERLELLGRYPDHCFGYLDKLPNVKELQITYRDDAKLMLNGPFIT